MSETTKEIETEAERRMLRALLSVVIQFFESEDNYGTILWHSFLSAGERTFECLEEFGLITPRSIGGGWEWTELAEQIRRDY